jgi:ribosomal subunit interface protein
MNIRIAFRGMEHSNAIENYAHKELEKLTKFLHKEPEPIYFDLVLEADKHHLHHKVELRINSKHFHFITAREGKDLYQELDHVIKVMGREIKKHKEKALDKRNHPEVTKDKI